MTVNDDKGRIIYYQVGCGYIQWGRGRKRFLVTYLGVIYFVRYLGGSDVFHWSLFSLKGIASSGGGGGGGKAIPTPISELLKRSWWEKRENNCEIYILFLLNKTFFCIFTFSLWAFNNNP